MFRESRRRFEDLIGGGLNAIGPRIRGFFAAYPRLTTWTASFTLVAGLLAFFALELESEYNATIANAESVSQSFADVLAEHTARTFEAVDRTFGVAMSIRNDLQAGRATTKSANLALQSLQKNSPSLLAIGWTNETGDIIARSDFANPVVRNIANNSFFISQRDSSDAGFLISPLYQSKTFERLIVSVSLRLNHPDGSFAGVLTAPIDPLYFARIYRSVNLGPNDVVTVVGRDGKILLREPFSENIIGQSLENTNFFLNLLPKSDFGTFITKSPIDGRERIFGYRSVPGLPLIMLVLQDRAGALGRWYEHIKKFGPVVGILIFIIILGTAILSYRTEQLDRESKLLSATLENMHEGLLVIDQNNRVAIYNSQALRLLNLPEAMMAKKPFTNDILRYQTRLGEVNLSDDINQRVLPQVNSAVEDISVQERRNGTVLEVRTVPFSPGGIVRTYKDISSWKKIETELNDREKKFRLLAENATDIIARLNFEGTLLYLSPSCHSILGYEVEELISTKIADYVHPDDFGPTVKLFDDIARGNAKKQSRIEYRFRHKAGHWIWLEANPRLICDASGKPLEFVDVVRETTDRKLMEAETEQAKQQALSAAAEQAQFLATMSHELRTPLNSIIGFSDIVLDRDDLAADVRRQIGLIQTASDTLLTVVNDVLDFSKIEEGKLKLATKDFELKALIDAVVAIVRGSADVKDLKLLVSIDTRISQRLAGDDQRIRQVLFNLLNNAIKFTPHGHVSLVAELVAQDDTTQRLRVSIADTGIGIPEGKLDQLFQRFSQVDGSISREYGGSGLGLAISKRLVEMMGGEIGVESKSGRGSNFWFSLCLPIALASSLPTISSPPPAGLGGVVARLLLVEDMEVNREIGHAILTSMGYKVDTVSDGLDAINSVQDNYYDLVLMDVQMPGMDGLSATRKIRALKGRAANIPIVAMTANVLPKQIEATRLAGMNGHVGKPFQRGQLSKELERCLGEATANLPNENNKSEQASSVDEHSIRTLTDLLGAAKIEKLLMGLKAQLEQFTSSNAGIAETAVQAHQLVSSSGMLGFSGVSKMCANFADSTATNAEINFDDVREVCLAALKDISSRLAQNHRFGQLAKWSLDLNNAHKRR